MTMDKEFGFEVEDKLEDALAMVAAGISPEEVLANAGDDARWLRPLLELADDVGEFQQSVSIPGPEASLQKMLSHAEKLAGSSSLATSAQPRWPDLLSNILRGGFRLATGLAMAVLVLLLAGGMFTLAAQRSLPGEPLYRLKRAGESLQLNLTRDPDRRERLHDTFNQRRQMEVNQLLAQGQEAQVTLQGQVHTVTPDSIELAGLIVQMTSDTRINGQLAPGVQVQAEIKIQPPDRVIALSITVVESPPAIPPSPTPTSTATPVKARATDTLPTLEPTATSVRSQEVDTLPTPAATPRAIPTEDTDFEDSAVGDDGTDAANENNNSDDNAPEDNANFDDNDNFEEDGFEDGDDVPAEDGDRGNDNSGDDDKGGNNSGSDDNGDNSGSDDVRDDNSGKGNSDDRDDNGDSSSDDDGGDDKSDDDNG